MILFLAGVYWGLSIVMFAYTLFCVCLGGNDDDLWMPFVYAVFWPVVVALWVMGVRR